MAGGRRVDHEGPGFHPRLFRGPATPRTLAQIALAEGRDRLRDPGSRPEIGKKPGLIDQYRGFLARYSAKVDTGFCARNQSLRRLRGLICRQKYAAKTSFKAARGSRKLAAA